MASRASESCLNLVRDTESSCSLDAAVDSRQIARRVLYDSSNTLQLNNNTVLSSFCFKENKNSRVAYMLSSLPVQFQR